MPGCKTSITKKLKAGAICTVNNGGGQFGVVKILVIDNEIAHLRIYKNKYSRRPADIDPTTLSLGTIYDKDGFGIGHTPLDRKGFEDMKPIVVRYETVSVEELEGYNIWKDQ